MRSMKNQGMLIILILLLQNVNAQDYIIKINGDTIRSKVIGTNDNTLIYKKSENPEGPSYHILNKEVQEIILQNGESIMIQPVVFPDSVLVLKIDNAIRSKQKVVLSLRQDLKKKVLITSRKGLYSIVCEGANRADQEIKIADITEISPCIIPNSGSFGVGFGIPYGMIGANLELSASDLVSFTAGAGPTIHCGLAYNAGCFVYLRNNTYAWRPRLSVLYGINCMIYETGNVNSEINESYTGFSFGIGSKFILNYAKTLGLNIDIMYLSYPEEFKKRIRELEFWGWSFTDDGRGNLKLAVGFAYIF